MDSVHYSSVDSPIRLAVRPSLGEHKTNTLRCPSWYGGASLCLPSWAWDNRQMKITSLPRPNEQRKIEKLLVKLAKIKSVSAKPAPTNSGKNLPQSACLGGFPRDRGV